MTILPTAREIAWHEASHASALCLAGITPGCVRIDQPTSTMAGSCKMDWERADPTPEVLKAVVVALMMGPLVDADRALHSWPVRPDDFALGSHRDAEQLAFLADVLKCDEIDWRWLLYKATAMARSREHRCLTHAIARALEANELLLRPELEELTRDVLDAVGRDT